MFCCKHVSWNNLVGSWLSILKLPCAIFWRMLRKLSYLMEEIYLYKQIEIFLAPHILNKEIFFVEFLFIISSAITQKRYFPPHRDCTLENKNQKRTALIGYFTSYLCELNFKSHSMWCHDPVVRRPIRLVEVRVTIPAQGHTWYSSIVLYFFKPICIVTIEKVV